MSRGRCLDPGELVGQESWPGDDPRLQHLRDCPRCQALLASYRLFAAAPDDLPPGRLAAARARLAEVRRAWPVTPAARPVPLATPERAGDSPPVWLRRWLGRARCRPALAFAALAVVVGAGYWAGASFLGGREPLVLRAGEEDHDAAPSPAVTLLAPQRGHERLALCWRAVPGADAYEVLLLDAGFTLLSRQATARDTVLELALPQQTAVDEAAPVYWQVVARRSGDVVAESVPAPLGTLGGR